MQVDPWKVVATGFGAGLAPYMPGTVGSLLAAVLWWYVIADLAPVAEAAILVLVCGIGWLSIRQVNRSGYGGDDSRIVVDEVAGQLTALLFLPKQLVLVVGAFALFRLLDIWKPGPIGWLDRKAKGAWGVLLDDLLAGVTVVLIAHAVMFVFGKIPV